MILAVTYARLIIALIHGDRLSVKLFVHDSHDAFVRPLDWYSLRFKLQPQPKFSEIIDGIPTNRLEYVPLGTINGQRQEWSVSDLVVQRLPAGKYTLEVWYDDDRKGYPPPILPRNSRLLKLGRLEGGTIEFVVQKSGRMRVVRYTPPKAPLKPVPAQRGQDTRPRPF